MPCRKFIIAGKVQGVFFRQSTIEFAQQIDLNGYAKNLPDGCVEVIACGDEKQLDQLQSWLQHGPPMARVDGVEATDAQDQTFDDFQLRY